MMLILPGQKADNRAWAAELASKLSRAANHGCHYYEYPWWKQPEVVLDPIVIARSLEDMGPKTIIAKSIGTLICSLAIHEGFIQPEKAIFIGVPLRVIGATELSWLKNAHAQGANVLIVQQTNDRVGSYADAVEQLSGNAVAFAEVPGEDHRYSDLDVITELCTSWLSARSSQ